MTDDERFFGFDPEATRDPSGAERERTELSVRVSDHSPGSVARLHRHPYEETMLIQRGRALYAIGEEVVEAGAGELVIVPPGVWHGFESLGTEPLRQIGMGAADAPVVEWREAA